MVILAARSAPASPPLKVLELKKPPCEDKSAVGSEIVGRGMQ